MRGVATRQCITVTLPDGTRDKATEPLDEPIEYEGYRLGPVVFAWTMPKTPDGHSFVTMVNGPDLSIMFGGALMESVKRGTLRLGERVPTGTGPHWPTLGNWLRSPLLSVEHGPASADRAEGLDDRRAHARELPRPVVEGRDQWFDGALVADRPEMAYDDVQQLVNRNLRRNSLRWPKVREHASSVP